MAKMTIPRGGTRFTAALLDGLSDDMRARRIRSPRLVVSDNVATGLRAIIRQSGNVTLHCHYRSPDGSRPMILLGAYPEMSIGSARDLVKTINALVARGIDPLEGMRRRVMAELLEKGADWRP
ncbi:MAG: Arm DNA-binding domain-containing protein [Pseudolabrys sp.]|nr:Arm DNA-binding domain-containing protein [Pseudolabrys sp.]